LEVALNYEFKKKEEKIVWKALEMFVVVCVAANRFNPLLVRAATALFYRIVEGCAATQVHR
jgi:hypothetical protein